MARRIDPAMSWQPDVVNEFVWDSTTGNGWIEATLERYGVDGICATHTGLPWIRQVSNGFWCNVGVLGRPAHDGQQQVYYGTLDFSNATQQPQPRLHTLNYDVAPVVAAMAAAGLPLEFQASLQQGVWTTCAEILPDDREGNSTPRTPVSPRGGSIIPLLGWATANPPRPTGTLPGGDVTFLCYLRFTAMLTTTITWALLASYGFFVYRVVQKTTPNKVSALAFFGGQSQGGQAPGMWLLVSSAAISWIFAKSIDNAASLGNAFGIWGGLGYSIYYLSFVTAAIALYFIRTRGGHRSIPEFLVSKYGTVCARLFLLAIAIRLINEVWSNTKVFSLYFGPEGSGGYWLAALVVTTFTVYYSLLGGLRSSLLTDGAQMLLAAVLLVVILSVLGPGLIAQGIPAVDGDTRLAGLTFCGLAFVQIFSYPFHDPVMTDRAFITSPKVMVKGFIWAGVISGGFIFLFSTVGLYARAFGVEGSPSLNVPALFGLPMLLVFNAIMLTSAGLDPRLHFF
jgi:hypothetical protein